MSELRNTNVYRRAMVLLVCFSALGGTSSAMAADAVQVYDFYCAQCHGLEGKGDGPNVNEHFSTDPRDFTDTAEMQKLSDDEIRSVILDGGPAVSKSELMPPWRRSLAEDEVEPLIAYLREMCACEGPQ